MLNFISEIVLSLHLCIVIYITSGFFLVPLGYKYEWEWSKNIKLRALHLGLICFVTVETLIGITCPLTVIEINLNNFDYSQSFVSYWLSKIIYWNLPTIFFITLYSTLTLWSILMWRIFPPKKLN